MANHFQVYPKNSLRDPKLLDTPNTLFTIDIAKMPGKKSGKVSISIDRTTAEELNKEKKYGETWDSLFKRLLMMGGEK